MMKILDSKAKAVKTVRWKPSEKSWSARAEIYWNTERNNFLSKPYLCNHHFEVSLSKSQL